MDGHASPGSRTASSHTGDPDELMSGPAPALPTKRQLGVASEADLVPAKRAKLTGTDTIQVVARFGADEDQAKRARLTRRNLALFNRKMAKSKGGRKALAAPGPSDSIAESSTTKTTTTSSTSPGFAIQAHKNGILNPAYSKPPVNLGHLTERLARPRDSASPPESLYQRYTNIVEGAPNEATMVVGMSGKLLQEYDDHGYHKVFNHAFTQFPKDVGFNKGLSAPQPDFVEGLRMQEFDPFPVDEHVDGAVLFKDDPFSLTLPHLAGEWKGRGKDMEEARLQSAYDGAALVYARNQALSYLEKPDPPSHAEVTTFTTDGTNINFFAHHTAPSPSGDGTLKYHQHRVTSTNLTNSHQEFKQGYRQLRNLQVYAREQSYGLRDQLGGQWKMHSAAGDLEAVAAEETPLLAAVPDNALVLSHPIPPSDDPAAGSGRKRKASPLSSSPPKRGVQNLDATVATYSWEWDDTHQRYFLVGGDGNVTWAEEVQVLTVMSPRLEFTR